MAQPPPDKFPVSQQRSLRGSRHLAREKVLQILVATSDGEVSLDVAFPHIFYRQFTFDSVENPADLQRILKPDEVFEMDADVPIVWAEEDLTYATTVLGAARDYRESSSTLIESHATNWEVERIALIDRVLMHLAVAELTACSDIPVKVTINEVIELAKRYSTDKSGTFINGILDAIIVDLEAQGKIHKSGRGLITD
ncbi:MAG: transcription antitermination factor NusB [bacterium]|nr:transcription antitermination factor NusB [bacterium]